MLWFNDMMQQPLLVAVLCCMSLQAIAWWWQRRTKNADVVDIAWTLGIMLCALIYLSYMSGGMRHTLMVMLFPMLWYARLLFHLVSRYDVTHEDSRYKNLRAHWSSNTQIKFFIFFQFQAGLSVLFSLPAYWLLQTENIGMWQVYLALALGLSALVGVTLADHQLLQFKRNNDSSQVCDVGFWRYSRHPNYFFEWVHWFVYPLLLWHSEYFWWSVMVVVLMLVFLLKLTGIPFSEQQALKKRGTTYKKYMNKTSSFIPWRRKND